MSALCDEMDFVTIWIYSFTVSVIWPDVQALYYRKNLWCLFHFK